jgi:hypothetical protein
LTTWDRSSRLGQSWVISTNKVRVATAQPQTMWRSPQCYIELMTEKQVLGFEPAPRLEDVADEHQE